MAPNGAVTVMVPVGVVQVGCCVTVAVGDVGTPKAGLIVTGTVAEVQSVAISLTITV